MNLVDLQPEDSAPPQVTGGYIIKKDRLDPGDTGFFTSTGQRLRYVEPKEEEITTAQASYLTGYLNQFESALYGAGFADPDTGYAAYIDAGLVHRPSHHGRDDEEHRRLPAEHVHVQGPRREAEHGADLGLQPDARQRQLSRGLASRRVGTPIFWATPTTRGTGASSRTRSSGCGTRIAGTRCAPDRSARSGSSRTSTPTPRCSDEAQVRNYVRWPILGTYVWPNWYIGITYQDEIDWMKQWLASRLAWMDGQFPAPPAFNHAPGQVPTGFNLTMTAAGGVIYYTLDGSDPRLPGGAIAAGAVAYAVPVPVLQLLHVKARALDGGVWSAINDATFAPVPPAYVNEVLPVNVTVVADEHGDFDPWIELYNPSTATSGSVGAVPHRRPGRPRQVADSRGHDAVRRPTALDLGRCGAGVRGRCTRTSG